MCGALGMHMTLKEDKSSNGCNLNIFLFTCYKKSNAREKQDLWTTKWGYTDFFSSFSSTKAGVGILFNNNFELQIMKNYIYLSGLYIICDLMANRKLLTLVNVYPPNDDDPNFFKTLADHMEDFQKDEIIIGGDFNTVLDVQKDKKGGLPKTHNVARRTDNEFFQLGNDTSLDENVSVGCDDLLTIKERLKALKDMASGKTPGIDELPAEFYTTFWDDIAPSLIASLNYAYKAGTFSVSQRQGVIKLIPKNTLYKTGIL